MTARGISTAGARTTVSAMLSLVLVLLAAGCTDGEALEISDARVRALIPGQEKTVGYFTAHNAGAADLVLRSARSAGARAVEMHITTDDGGVARMRRLQEVVIPAGDTVRFEPGGRHLMLFGVPETGEAMEIVLETADGRQFPVRFETVSLMAGDTQ